LLFSERALPQAKRLGALSQNEAPSSVRDYSGSPPLILIGLRAVTERAVEKFRLGSNIATALSRGECLLRDFVCPKTTVSLSVGSGNSNWRIT
jgi:hypothetical protein